MTVYMLRKIIFKCTLILADEPTGSLDRRNAEIVISILKKLNEEGITIILVTHNEELKERGDRIIEL